MAAHRNNGELQHMALSLLRFLSMSSKDNCTKIIEASGITAILAAMKLHQNDVKVQEEACETIHNLAMRSKDNRHYIGAVGAIEDVILALKVHKNNPNVVKAGIGAISILALHPSNQCAFVAAGAVELIVMTMKRHQNMDAKLQEKACRALVVLAHANVKGGVNKAIVANGGISAVVFAMKTHKKDVDVQSFGTLVLYGLASDPVVVSEIRRQGGEPVLEQNKRNSKAISALSLIRAAKSKPSPLLKKREFVC